MVVLWPNFGNCTTTVNVWERIGEKTVPSCTPLTVSTPLYILSLHCHIIHPLIIFTHPLHIIIAVSYNALPWPFSHSLYILSLLCHIVQRPDRFHTLPYILSLLCHIMHCPDRFHTPLHIIIAVPYTAPWLFSHTPCILSLQCHMMHPPPPPPNRFHTLYILSLLCHDCAPVFTCTPLTYYHCCVT